MESFNETATIRDTCDTCIAVYQQCLPFLDPETFRLLRFELDRLKIWAGTIGVYARSPASADDRLSSDEELKLIVIKLLSRIARLLERFQMQHGLEASNEQYPPSSESSLSSNSSSQRHLEGFSANTVRTVRVLRRIRRIIGQLFSILSLVRRPTSLSANEKVFNNDYVSKLGPEYQALLDDFENYTDFYLRHNFQSGSKDEPCTVPQYLLDRLKQAAVIRRKALIHKSIHNQKLRGNVAAKFRQLPFQSADITPQVLAKTAHHDEIPVETIPPGEAASRVLSDTVPSVVPNLVKFPQIEPAPPRPKSSKSVIHQRSRLDVPPPPKLTANALEFECYICGLALDKAEAQGDRWKKHVLADIDPFVCLFRCSKPDVLYKTGDEWYKHMQEHRTERCCMTTTHRHLVFRTAEKLNEHLESDHALHLSKAQRKLLLKRGMRALPSIFDDCPLCGRDAGDIQADGSLGQPQFISAADDKAVSKILSRHIESHMYEIALLSVPPYPDHTSSQQSAAVNEGSDPDHDKSFEERLVAEDLLRLPRETDELGRASTHVVRLHKDLQAAQADDQVPNMFFEDDEDRATVWTAFAESQVQPPDSFDRPGGWDKVRRTLETKERVHNDHASQHFEEKVHETFRANAEARISTPANARLTFAVPESICTNKHICKAVTELIEPLDITILSPDASGQRSCWLYFASYEAALAALTKMRDFEIRGLAVPCHPPDRVDRPDDERFEHLRVLGKGPYGATDCVRERNTGTIYARKTFTPNPGFDPKLLEQRIRNQAKALSKLRHNHIATVNFMFKDGTARSIIMLPVADCDLRLFLERCVNQDYPRKDVRLLDLWFGCLISALAYVHREAIKHGDIKPSNILIKGRKVYLMDFVNEKGFSELEESTATGYLEHGTPVYWSPEHRPWGRAADVFALGCVFSEMFTVRQERSLLQFRNFRFNPSAELGHAFRSNLVKVRLWLTVQLPGVDTKHPIAQLICEQILNMLEEDKGQRIEADRVRHNLRPEESLFCVSCF